MSYLQVCACVSLCLQTQEARRTSHIPSCEVAGVCDPPGGSRELSPGPLQEQ